MVKNAGPLRKPISFTRHTDSRSSWAGERLQQFGASVCHCQPSVHSKYLPVNVELQDTLEYISNSQSEAGYWDEPEEIRHYDPPPWMLPGRYENQLWLTSAVCCKLRELGCEYEVRFDQALDFLRKGWNGQRYPLFHHTNWMVMVLLGMLQTKLDSDSQIITRCKKHLIKAIENDLVDPGDLSAISYASILAGYQAQDLLEISIRKMQENQLEDSIWRTNYGEKYRLGLTVDALFTFKRLGKHISSLYASTTCLATL